MPEHADEPPRLPLADAATKLGKSQEAVRAMIRRGRLATIRGNDGRLLVSIPPELVRKDDRPSPDNDATALGEALAEADHWRERAHQAELEAASARAERDAAREVAEVKVAATERLVTELQAMLVEARRPWWRRWLSS
jgi:hypothetical protein